MSRKLLLAGYLLLAVIASVQQWYLQRPDDQYTHYNNYVIFRQSFFHLIGRQDLYVMYLAEHWDYFRYSPSFALAFGAFAWMPDLAGLLLWNTLNALVLFLAWATLPVRDERMKLAAGWFVAIEMMTALQNAQSNVLIAGLLILAFNCLERRRVGLAALMIVVASFTKPFGLVGFSLFLLYPGKKKFIMYSALWMMVVALLPLVAVPPAQLVRLYQSWWNLMVMDFGDSAGLSITGWLQSWFSLNPSKIIVDLLGVAVFCWPLVLKLLKSSVERSREFSFRLLVLCNVLVWVVIFNHKAESSTYIIAVCGVALWFFSQEMTRPNVVLAALVFIFTCLSPTDVFPRSLSASFFVPYAIKAVPCILVWGKITYELVSGNYKPKPLGPAARAHRRPIIGGRIEAL